VRAALDATAWIGATSLPVTVLSPSADDAAIARALDVLGAAVRAAGGARVAEMRVRCGHAVDELVAETARARAGLVVARRRPSKGLFHLIRRSTTAQTLRRLSVPLLLLPEGTAWVRRLR
jgi:nucleotide-binding universal stress UspA family protein